MAAVSADKLRVETVKTTNIKSGDGLAAKSRDCQKEKKACIKTVETGKSTAASGNHGDLVTPVKNMIRTRTRSGVIRAPGSHYQRRFLETDDEGILKKLKTPGSGKGMVTSKPSDKRQSSAGISLKITDPCDDADNSSIKVQRGRKRKQACDSLESIHQKNNPGTGDEKPQKKQKESDTMSKTKTGRGKGKHGNDLTNKSSNHEKLLEKSKSSWSKDSQKVDKGEVQEKTQVKEVRITDTNPRNSHAVKLVKKFPQDSKADKPFATDSTTDSSVCSEGSKKIEIQKTMTGTGKASTCDVCGKVFRLVHLMEKHRLTHSNHNTSAPVGDVEIDMLGTDAGVKQFKCDSCEKSFTTASLLKKHSLLHKRGENVEKNKELVCNVCSKVFCNIYTLKKHKLLHTGAKPFVCDVCGKGFTQVSNLKMHQVIHTGEKTFKCDTCSKAFARAGDLKKHKLTHSDVKPFVCDVCSKAFVTAYYLSLHKDIHSSEKPFKCDVCGKSFTKPSALKVHKVIHTGLRPFKCDLCSKAFNTAGNLKEHKETHTGRRPFKCHLCGRTFTKSFPLKKHMMLHTGIRPHPCGVCMKGYATKSELEIHKRTHTGERPYKCAHCVADFFRKANLLQHVNAVHKGLRPYICDVCGKGFTEARSLVEHGRIHSGEKPYVCDTCGKAFTQASTLKNHKRIHSGEKPYPCLHCGKRFSEISSRNRHHRTHTGETPYKCSLCPADFSRLEALKVHVRNQHPDSTPGEGSKREIKDHAALDHSYDAPVSTAQLSNSRTASNTGQSAGCVPCVITVFDDNGIIYQGPVFDSGSGIDSTDHPEQEFPYVVTVNEVKAVSEEGPNQPRILTEVSSVDARQIKAAPRYSSDLAFAPVAVKLENGSGIDTAIKSESDHVFAASVPLSQEDTNGVGGYAFLNTVVKEEIPASATAAEEIENSILSQDQEVGVSGDVSETLVYHSTEDGCVLSRCVDVLQWDKDEHETKMTSLQTECANGTHSVHADIVEIVIEGQDGLRSVVETLVDSSGALRARLAEAPAETEEPFRKVIVKSEAEQNSANLGIVTCPKESSDFELKPVIEQPQHSSPGSGNALPGIANNAPESHQSQEQLYQAPSSDCAGSHHAILRDLLTEPPSAARDSRPKVNKKTLSSLALRPAGTKGLFSMLKFRKRRYGAVPKAWICEVCGHGFTQSASLRKHIAVQHNSGRTIKCDLCRKPCRSKSELESHKRSHTGARPFQCHLCEKTYKHNGDLQQHILAGHMGAKPYTCDECSKTFTEKRSLKEHKLIHVGLRPHKCSCGKAFTQLGTLKKHQRTHQQGSMENLCVCETCGKGFSSQVTLSKHKLLHTGEKPYRCVHCPAAFARGEQLKQHKTDAHPDKLQDLAAVASLALASR